MTPLRLCFEPRTWATREPFVISRGAQTQIDTLLVSLTDEEGHRGRGEACGVTYAGESPATMAAELDAVAHLFEKGMDRERLLTLLPAGGARAALDAALWDLEARQRRDSVFAMAGFDQPTPAITAYTIGIRSIEGYEAAAAERRLYPLLKIKVDEGDPLAAVEAVRRGAPDAKLIVDPNQAWSVETLKSVAPALRDLGVVLLEQPIPVGAEARLDGYRCPIPLCADELINDRDDIAKARGRFDVINIKLDKAGGLTEALHLAEAASAAGFTLMVGCMGGSSLSMAPGMVLAQRCAFVDLDGPLLQVEDWPDGLVYRNGVVDLPSPAFWGGAVTSGSPSLDTSAVPLPPTSSMGQ